jgi:hypothetical protein
MEGKGRELQGESGCREGHSRDEFEREEGKWRLVAVCSSGRQWRLGRRRGFER